MSHLNVPVHTKTLRWVPRVSMTKPSAKHVWYSQVHGWGGWVPMVIRAVYRVGRVVMGTW